MKTHGLTIKIRAKKPKNVRNCESLVKAVYFMERSCPMSSMAPVLAITEMVTATS
jgi:hypothetical protein